MSIATSPVLATRPTPHTPPVGWTALTALAPAVWGTTYIVTTHLLPEGHPLFAAILRALPAGLIALVVSRRLPHGSWWWKSAVLGAGPGGQSVNTTDSAVRITHLPTGITASCQNEKSQLQNKDAAMRMLRARILAKQAEEAAAEVADIRRSQVRTVDRSERIRTYNFPENRITDHRIGYKAHNLDQVLEGDLDAMFDALAAADKQTRLQQTT